MKRGVQQYRAAAWRITKGNNRRVLLALCTGAILYARVLRRYVLMLSLEQRAIAVLNLDINNNFLGELLFVCLLP